MEIKQYYINTYNKMNEDGLKNHILNGGNENNYDEEEYFINSSQIVGYYLLCHKENALNQWLENISYLKIFSNTDKEVTRILQELFN